MYLGIDLGTSGVKVVLLGADGRIADQAKAPLRTSSLHPSWSEQAPEDWWAAVETAVMALDPMLRSKVRGVGLSGQMHGAVLLGAADTVLRPAILWNDGRSQKQCAELLEIEPRASRITGNPVLAGFTAPKLLWVKEKEPDIFKKVRRVLLPKDWLRLGMTGEAWSEMSDASGTLWLDVANRRWSPEMLAACDLDEAMMPRLCEGSDASAKLSREIAARWGMALVPVAGGGGDNAAGAIGLGVIEPGQSFLSLGTSGVIFTVTDGFRPNPAAAAHAFAHAVPDRWHQMSVMLSAAACLDWAANLTGIGDVSTLLSLSLEADERSDMLFLPYLSGERTPHGDPAARAAFFGMDGHTGRAELARAVLEGVAMGLRDGLDAITTAGSDRREISLAGGGSRSDAWARIIAATLERPLVWHEGGDIGPALGAARLGRVAAGDGSIAEVCIQPPICGRVDPDARLSERMRRQQERFRSLYRAAEPLFERL